MPLSPRFSDALLYAATLHQDQRRKVSGTPYVAHLLRVAGIVLENGGSEDEAIAALLHDAIEDQGPDTRDEIRRRYGEAVVEIVEGCSDAHGLPKPPWQERKEAHLAHLRQAPASVRLVVAADKLDNARSLIHEYRLRGESLWSYFRGGREGTLWYYRSMAAVLREGGTSPLVEELDRALGDLERLIAERRE